ncbi:hypothetical protein T265_07556 [Opisthorchis viverrini]|uniref:Uncharacterized protein n=1 Tax=Opisthorchis viverrini TaxID=6198 RepID=A0A074ZGT6_OPIVI|nr:hypothetical protein T265_07556 [Opisthorchis viverrini]KER24882.1 hypothetical protein T265_07556 [Opisthorchis viverrini]
MSEESKQCVGFNTNALFSPFDARFAGCQRSVQRWTGANLVTLTVIMISIILAVNMIVNMVIVTIIVNLIIIVIVVSYNTLRGYKRHLSAKKNANEPYGSTLSRTLSENAVQLITGGMFEMVNHPAGLKSQSQEGNETPFLVQTAKNKRNKVFVEGFDTPVDRQAAMRRFKTARMAPGCDPTVFFASLQHPLDRALLGLDSVAPPVAV